MHLNIHEREGGLPGKTGLLRLVIFLGVTVAILITGYTYYTFEAERILKETYEDLANIARQKTDQIVMWRKQRLNDATVLAKGVYMTQVLPEWSRDRGNYLLPKQLQDRIVLEQQTRGYADIVFFDLDGNTLLSAKPDPAPLSPVEKEAVKESLSRGAAIMSNPFASSHDIVQVATVAPVLDQGGEAIAVLVMRSDYESLLSPLVKTWITPLLTNEVFMVCRDGDEVLFLNQLRNRTDAPLTVRHAMVPTLPATQAILGRQGPFEGKDYRGEKVLSYLRRIPDSAWFIIAKVDKNEVLKGIYFRGVNVALFTGVLILISGTLIAYSYRRRQATMYKDLYELEQECTKSEEARAFLASIVDSSDEAIIGKDLDGTIISWNKAAERMYGYTAEEAKGQSIRVIIPSGLQPQLESLLEKVARGERTEHLDTIRVTKDGGEIPVLMTLSPIKDSLGKIVGASAVARDISEIKRYEAELRQAKELAEAGSKAKSAFLAIMSHELRTPLNSIIGFSEVLQDKTFGDLTAKQSKYVANVLISALHLLSLINDILDLAKIEARKTELHRSEIKVREILEECFLQVEDAVHKDNLELSLNVPDDLIALADKRSLKQIMCNLLSNAVKFTPSGGKISVTVEKKADELAFSVRDTGIGVKPEDQERIFHEFEQIDSGTSRKYQGTGLGLPLTRKLVELSGGTMWMESEGEYKGSVFSFTIPKFPPPTGEQMDGKTLGGEVT